MNLDAYMDSFGRDLTRAARTRRRRAGRRLALAVPVAVAAAAVAIVVPGGGGTVDAIAAARAALAPEGGIVHMKIRSGNGRGRALEIEQWYAADPERWRTSAYVRGRGRVEMGEVNGRLRVRDDRRDVITIYRDAQLARGATPIGSDPAADLRAQLAAGDVRDDGVVTVDGRQVRRLVRDRRAGAFTHRLVFYMDPATFAPLGGHDVILRKGRAPLRMGAFTVTGYERLPFDARLLTLSRTPKTRYVWR